MYGVEDKLESATYKKIYYSLESTFVIFHKQSNNSFLVVNYESCF